jgi:hypothetical protein
MVTGVVSVILIIYETQKEDFVSKARQVHGDRYTYDNFVYQGSRTKGYITCPEHGDFLQKPNTHISRPAGCPRCDIENRKGSYSYDYFEKNPSEKVKDGFLYVVRLHQHGQSFIKIGMAVDVSKRLHYYYGMDKQLLLTKPGRLYEIYDLEQRLLSTLKPHKFYPQTAFEGYTECVRDKQEVLDAIEELLVTP